MQFLIIPNIPIPNVKVDFYEDDHREEVYDILPRKYKKTKWPSKTNLPCYNCTIVTNRIPLFVPAIIQPNGIIFRCDHQSVCSVPCALSWIYENAKDDAEKRRYIANLRYLVREMTGYDLENYTPAMSRSTLKKFGGKFSDHQYQREIILLSGRLIQKLYTNPADYYYDLS